MDTNGGYPGYHPIHTLQTASCGKALYIILYNHIYPTYNICIYIYMGNFNISLTWIKAIWGWFPLLTMIIVRSQWGRYNLPRSIYICVYICNIYMSYIYICNIYIFVCNIYIHMYMYILHIYIYVYIYIRISIHICICIFIAFSRGHLPGFFEYTTFSSIFWP